jgi:hypothetical protein
MSAPCLSPVASEAKRSAVFKTAILAVIWLLFIIYIPVGLPLAEATYVKVCRVGGSRADVLSRPYIRDAGF